MYKVAQHIFHSFTSTYRSMLFNCAIVQKVAITSNHLWDAIVVCYGRLCRANCKKNTRAHQDSPKLRVIASPPA